MSDSAAIAIVAVLTMIAIAMTLFPKLQRFYVLVLIFGVLLATSVFLQG
jgi:hypothetical protein